jgi:hypothetical protein
MHQWREGYRERERLKVEVESGEAIRGKKEVRKKINALIPYITIKSLRVNSQSSN